MTDAELYNYFYQLCLNSDISKDKNVTGWNARDVWHQLEDIVYNKYGRRLINPTHVCESLNPFTIHFTWNDNDGNVLGCSVNEKPEVYVCFTNIYFVKDESSSFITKYYSWKEFLYLPKIQISERLMEVFYVYYLEKNNGH